jgi:hypothetical protein
MPIEPTLPRGRTGRVCGAVGPKAATPAGATPADAPSMAIRRAVLADARLRGLPLDRAARRPRTPVDR